MATLQETQVQIQNRKEEIARAKEQVELQKQSIPQTTQQQLRGGRGYPQGLAGREFQRKLASAREQVVTTEGQLSEYETGVKEYEKQMGEYLGTDAGKLQYAQEQGIQGTPIYDRIVKGGSIEIVGYTYDTPYGQVSDMSIGQALAKDQAKSEAKALGFNNLGEMEEAAAFTKLFGGKGGGTFVTTSGASMPLFNEQGQVAYTLPAGSEIGINFQSEKISIPGVELPSSSGRGGMNEKVVFQTLDIKKVDVPISNALVSTSSNKDIYSLFGIKRDGSNKYFGISSGVSSGDSGSVQSTYSSNNIISNFVAGIKKAKETYDPNLNAFTSVSSTGLKGTVESRPPTMQEARSLLPVSNPERYVNADTGVVRKPTASEFIFANMGKYGKEYVAPLGETAIGYNEAALSFLMKPLTRPEGSPSTIYNQVYVPNVNPRLTSSTSSRSSLYEQGNLKFTPEEKYELETNKLTTQYNYEQDFINRQYEEGTLDYKSYSNKLSILTSKQNKDLEDLRVKYIKESSRANYPYTLAQGAAIGIVSTIAPPVGVALGGMFGVSAIKNRAAIAEQFKVAPRESANNLLLGAIGGFAGAKPIAYLKAPVRVRLPSGGNIIKEISIEKSIQAEGKAVNIYDVSADVEVPSIWATEQPRWRSLLEQKPKTVVKVADSKIVNVNARLVETPTSYSGIAISREPKQLFGKVYSLDISKETPTLKEAPTSVNKFLAGQFSKVITGEQAENIFISQGKSERLGKLRANGNIIPYKAQEIAYTTSVSIKKPIVKPIIRIQKGKSFVDVPSVYPMERYVFVSKSSIKSKPSQITTSNIEEQFARDLIGKAKEIAKSREIVKQQGLIGLEESTLKDIIDFKRLPVSSTETTPTFPRQIKSGKIDRGVGTNIQIGEVSNPLEVNIPKASKSSKVISIEQKQAVSSQISSLAKPSKVNINKGLSKVETKPFALATMVEEQIKILPKTIAPALEEQTKQSFTLRSIEPQKVQSLDLDSKTATKLDTLTLTKTDSKLDSKLGLRIATRLDSILGTRTGTKVAQKTNVGLVAKMKEMLKVKQEQKSALRTTTTTIQRTSSKPKSPKKPIIKQPKLMMLPSDNLAKKANLLKKAYQVITRLRGKEIKVGGILPEGKAKQLGVKTTLESARASFRLKEVGSTTQEDIPFKIPGELFGMSKRDSGTYVQKLTSRLGRRGELKEVIKSRRGGNKFKWL